MHAVQAGEPMAVKGEALLRRLMPVGPRVGQGELSYFIFPQVLHGGPGV